MNKKECRAEDHSKVSSVYQPIWKKYENMKLSDHVEQLLVILPKDESLFSVKVTVRPLSAYERGYKQ